MIGFLKISCLIFPFNFIKVTLMANQNQQALEGPQQHIIFIYSFAVLKFYEHYNWQKCF